MIDWINEWVNKSISEWIRLAREWRRDLDFQRGTGCTDIGDGKD